MIWRRLQIPGYTSLADFHHVIQIVFGWEDDHLHRFHIYGKDYGIAYAGGLSFSDDAHLVSLDDFDFDIGDLFIYEYSFFEFWIHDIRVEAIETGETSPTDPFCVKGNGMPLVPPDTMKLNVHWISSKRSLIRMNPPRWAISVTKLKHWMRCGLIGKRSTTD